MRGSGGLHTAHTAFPLDESLEVASSVHGHLDPERYNFGEAE
jgi:hypothetical protein